MGYHTEKEQNNVQAIVIDSWDTIANSPYEGTNKMTQVNKSIPGELSAGYPGTVSTINSGTFGIPIHRTTQFVLGSATHYFMLTTLAGSESLVFRSTTGAVSSSWDPLTTGNTNTSGTQTNQGLIFWKGYLIKFRDSHIDLLLGGLTTSTWISNWDPSNGSTTSSAVIVAATNHYSLFSVDNVVYFTNGPGVGSIAEVPGQTFDPTNAATYVFSAANGIPGVSGTTGINALDLPVYDSAQSLAEQQNSLLVGGSLNNIYSWDKLSIFFNYPIQVSDGFIRRMVTANTNTYIFTGNYNSRGRIYVTNGSQANLFFKIPDYLFGEIDPFFVWGDAMWHRNNLVFGFYVLKNGGGTISSNELWAMELGTNQYGTATESGFRSITTQLASSGMAGVANALLTDSSNSNPATPGMAFIVGVYDISNAGGQLRYSGTTSGTGNWNVTTDLIPVGTLFESRTFSQVEFKLRSPLQSGESIQIDYIDNNGTGMVGTSSFATDGGIISAVYTVNFEKSQWLQFKFFAIGASPLSGVRLKEIRLR